MADKVFIIHGRDLEARAELAKFLRSIGLEDMPFEDVASSLPPNPFVADVVREGIRRAAAVIAIFTPDEHSVFHDPATAASPTAAPGETRWQARPNVIFEAGIALGCAREKTILTAVGNDVKLFSDLLGVHLIRLDSATAKQSLFNQLRGIPGLAAAMTAAPGAMGDAASGDFASIARARWPCYDELHDLARQLADRPLHKGGMSLLEAVHRVVAAPPRKDWRRRNPEDFVIDIASAPWARSTTAENAYWWLVVYGFFAFEDIDDWYQGEDVWRNSVGNVKFTERGLMLIEKLRLMPDPPEAPDEAAGAKAPKRTTKKKRG